VINEGKWLGLAAIIESVTNSNVVNMGMVVIENS